MNGPVLILQNLSADGPGFLATWLQARGVTFDVIDAEAGQAYPSSIGGYRALAVLGGEMSANDPLPSLRQAESLIREAMALERPVIGHCLGGQLMARALGAQVRASPAPEIGWQTVEVADHDAARGWFGLSGPTTVFQWHGESFDLPAGARLLASSAACRHQAFEVGRHLAMQFHPELDHEKLAAWSGSTDPAYLALQGRHPSVQSGLEMRADAARRLASQQRLAAHAYTRWLALA